MPGLVPGNANLQNMNGGAAHRPQGMHSTYSLLVPKRF